MATRHETRSRPQDAIALLQADRQKVRQLFRTSRTAKDQATPWAMARHVFTALERHTSWEDTVHYAAFAVEADEAGERLIGDAFRAHQLCTCLMEELCDLTPNAVRFARRWHALRDQIEPHMHEEERELLPQAAQVLATHWEEITVLLRERKAHLPVS